MLELLESLVQFGLYNFNELYEIVGDLVRTLDGRNDELYEKGGMRKTQPIELNANCIDDGYTSRYKKTQSTLLLMQCKMRIISILTFIYNFKLNLRLSKLLYQFKANQTPTPGPPRVAYSFPEGN